jgi:KDO2-lipid IV(A) lauroyltransferase
MISPILYRLIAKYRKRALSNLALAKELKFSYEEIISISKESLFHLFLTSIEYAKLHRIKKLTPFVKTVNDGFSNHLLDQNKGVVFFCGHQSNWELLFLDATSRHKGVCIGKPIKNKKLYEFILGIRQKFKGKVVEPKDAYKACMKALKKGELVGVVGDQGMPDSGFSSLCFGRKAFSTTLPALLALRSSSPLIVATIERSFGQYTITYSDPVEISSDEKDPIYALTEKSLKILNEAIKKNPAQWMWQHNRWKINYPPYVPKAYRHDAIAIIVPNDSVFISELSEIFETYQGAYFIGFVPSGIKPIKGFDETILYNNTNDCFITHFGPKLIFDGVGIKGLEKHFKKQALFTYCTVSSPKNLIKSWRDSLCQ